MDRAWHQFKGGTREYLLEAQASSVGLVEWAKMDAGCYPKIDRLIADTVCEA